MPPARHSRKPEPADESLPARLEAAIRPLSFAAEDDFARLDRVKGLEATLGRGGRALLEGPLPQALKEALLVVCEICEAPVPEDPDERLAGLRRVRTHLAPFTSPDWPRQLLEAPLTVLHGVGKRRAEALAKRGIRCVEQLLYHLPSGYDDRRALTDVGDLEVGRRATFLAEVQSTGTASARMRGGRMGRVFEAVVGDDTGSVSLKWFHGGDALESTLKKGATVIVTGDVRRHRFTKQLVHPEVEAVEDEDPEQVAEQLAKRLDAFRRVVPRYPAIEGLPPRTLRGWVEAAVAEYADLAPAWLPEAVVEEHGLPPLADALRIVHAPPFEAEVEEYERFASASHRRLVLEELFLLELGLALRHAETARLPGVPLDVKREEVARAAEALPFALTGAQARVWKELRGDLAKPHPMNRLVQGDVGSGKTVVALLAAVAAAANGQQAALMAPTELLAEQHVRTLARLAGSGERALPIRIALLTASVPRAEADAVRERLRSGEVDLVVGTHALLQDDVGFARLALVVVDEQHRFGVLQRKALLAKRDDGLHPHTLVMTATPIPRTLALTLYGDLDSSVVDELPPGRSPVRTLLMRAGEGAAVARLVGETVERGEQVYVVYPLVEESERVDLRSALESAERIARAFPKARVDVVHGRLDPEERRAAMARFERGETRILVSTTVIEVGVDVPRATLMVIEHAERFGLAQLHQLRGRVGRGELPGTCVMVSRARKPARASEPEGEGADADDPASRGEARLRAMLETTDGFEIAAADLRIRGPGEFLGTQQSGHLPDLRIADLLRDQRLLGIARTAAFALVEVDPGLAARPALREAVELRWGERLSLAGVG